MTRARFVRDGASSKQRLGRRRGKVFSVRLTDDERAEFEALQVLGGPSSLGAWLKWAAAGNTRAGDAGNTRARRAVVPSRRAVVPVQGRSDHVIGLIGSTRSSGRVNAASGVVKRGNTKPRRILDLCSGSGAWGAPYHAAGYEVIRVTLPARDVRTWIPPKNVWGVLAAPPCEAFSLAANGHRSHRRDFVSGLETLAGCLRIIALCRPRWWALENPAGYLSRFMGTARDVWEPCDFGDPWTKRTALWGDFVLPKRGPFVKPRGAGPPCELCDPRKRKTMRCNSAAHRAVTPPGFARAFFEANP